MKLLLAASVLVGLALVGCGDSSTTTIITTAPTPTSSGGVPSGAQSFVGTTDQGQPISFTVLGSTVNSVRFGWTAKCDDGQVHSNTIALGSAPIADDGSFSVSGTLTTGGYGQVDGKIDGDNASGTLSRSKGSAFGTNCVASGVTWEAHAGS
jgi:hypothetical protein